MGHWEEKVNYLWNNRESWEKTEIPERRRITQKAAQLEDVWVVILSQWNTC
jgi:hypothetical protein